ncbi:protein of unknown function DUF305 [Gemmatirosa kalamazoonensis]|uniref:DUF305 domain-containing protein n=1 Tax=Gemmatirosa kalamazoonensis TaxID=861299 RepID=W0RMG3_9BACT|nr:DUF305 domain-containing protein [Gemmatirosa kalamazoonensis]AHG91657.1 protein of unknown function DUF305 [Gemmatirosa kalamazoonensis]
MPPQAPASSATLLVAAIAVLAVPLGAQSPAARDSAYVARARADSARRPYTAADVRFMSGMIGHHAQAIYMSRMAPTHDASEAVRTLAARIINAQQDEIAIMQRWLRDREKPVPDPLHTAGMPGMEGMHHELMPGMLTDAQLQQLDSARGPEFDRLFLRFMIQHHSGAISMVKDLFDSYGAGQDETVFKFATDVNVDQSTEVARMQRMLAALLFGAPR